MKRLTNHTKSGLFLMEMIICLLFLGLTCAVTLRLFSWAYVMRTEARSNNHIQELIVTASELLEGWDGSKESFLAGLEKAGCQLEEKEFDQDLLALEDDSLPENSRDGFVFSASYDRHWLPSSFEKGMYLMQGECRGDEYENTLALVFVKRIPGSDELERIKSFTVSFPAK